MKLIPKKKETKIKSIANTSRKVRETKPVSLRPDAFYASSRFGHSHCDECNECVPNALVGLVLTCVNGHSRTLLGHKKEEEVTGDDTMTFFFV